MKNKPMQSCIKVFWKKLLYNERYLPTNQKGLTYIDLMVGMVILMLGITVVGVGVTFSNYSSADTRELYKMADLAVDVSEFIKANQGSTAGAIAYGNTKGDPRYEVFIDTETVLIDAVPSDVEQLTVTVKYREGYDGVDEDEDDDKYRLSFYLLDSAKIN